VTATTCVVCERPVPDTAYACPSCALRLAQTLREASGHAEDAEAVLARQTRYGSGSRGGSSDSLPVDLTASTRYAAISLTVGGWMRVLIEEGYAPEPDAWRPLAGALCPPARPGDEPRRGNRCTHGSCIAIRDQGAPSALAQALTWLSAHCGQLRKHPAAREAFAELHDACAQLERLVDRPADKVLVGVCDCGKVLYAALGRTAIRCPDPCGATWNVSDGLDILRKHLDGRLFTAAEAAPLAVRLTGADRSTEQVRKLINAWSARGLIERRGEVIVQLDGYDEDGLPKTRTDGLYRFGDVADRLATTPTRTPRDREGAAA